MSCWTHIILEGFCLYGSMSKKKWKGFKYDDVKDIVDGKKGEEVITVNKDYVMKTKRPAWCKKDNKKRIPQYRCFKCPFFAFTNAERKVYEMLSNAYGDE